MNDYEYIYPGTNISIHDVQQVELELMIEFDRICRKYNIPYQMFGGTLLGAVRHKGFIPWDDDVDIAMLRRDYNRFLEVAESELDPSMFLQTCFTDPNSIIQFLKIRKNGTIYENKKDVGTDFHKGIWIDIFPFDFIKMDRLSAFIMANKIKFLYAWTTSTMKTRVESGKTKFRVIVRRILSKTTKLVKKEKIDRMLLRELTKYKKDTGYVSHLTNRIFKKRFNNPEKSKYKRTNVQRTSDFLDLCELEFCGHMFFAPRNYDKVLTDTYGDYMKMPPEEERIPLHTAVNIKV